LVRCITHASTVVVSSRKIHSLACLLTCLLAYLLACLLACLLNDLFRWRLTDETDLIDGREDIHADDSSDLAFEVGAVNQSIKQTQLNRNPRGPAILVSLSELRHRLVSFPTTRTCLSSVHAVGKAVVKSCWKRVLGRTFDKLVVAMTNFSIDDYNDHLEGNHLACRPGHEAPGLEFLCVYGIPLVGTSCMLVAYSCFVLGFKQRRRRKRVAATTRPSIAVGNSKSSRKLGRQAKMTAKLTALEKMIFNLGFMCTFYAVAYVMYGNGTMYPSTDVRSLLGDFICEYHLNTVVRM
jgi:hypothetical protein